MVRVPCALGAILLLLPTLSLAQAAAEARENEAVGASLNYVFATELGSGVYDLDGRTLQIYRLTYDKELRELDEHRMGVRFVLPVTFGFLDFKPFDVLSEGIPTRVDSFSVVPGLELDFPLRNEWHLIPYARAGASIASSSVDGWLYGLGARLERNKEWHGWNSFTMTELNLAGVGYRQDLRDDQFARLRQGFDLTRGVGWKIRGRHVELGLYGIFDVILDPPTMPVAEARKQPLQAEFGFTFSTRPVYHFGWFDVPRLGFGYRLAGELSAWHFLIGKPF